MRTNHHDVTEDQSFIRGAELFVGHEDHHQGHGENQDRTGQVHQKSQPTHPEVIEQEGLTVEVHKLLEPETETGSGLTGLSVS